MKKVYLRQDAGHVEDLCVQVGEVGHHKNKNGLDHPDLVGEASDKSREKTPHYPYHSSANGHHKE